MAFENRNAKRNRYYYRKKRIGNRVISEYIGGGEIAVSRKIVQFSVSRQNFASIPTVFNYKTPVFTSFQNKTERAGKRSNYLNSTAFSVPKTGHIGVEQKGVKAPKSGHIESGQNRGVNAKKLDTKGLDKMGGEGSKNWTHRRWTKVVFSRSMLDT